MYRKYFQLVQCVKTFIYANQPVTLNMTHTNYLPKRWAGHSKWQNIKSTKQHFDQMKSTKFSRLARLIAAAVKTGGEDPATNGELKRLIEEAQKNNMTKASIQKAIASANNQSERPYWTVFTGPKGLVLGLEVTFSNTNTNFLRSKLSQVKKLNLKIEPHFRDFCVEKGIIITNFLEKFEKSYDKALEDGIEIGANEVYETDDKSLIFECLPERIDSLSEQLSKRGYEVLSASVELDFVNTINLNDNEKEEIENFISKLQSQNEEILRACYNLEG